MCDRTITPSPARSGAPARELAGGGEAGVDARPRANIAAPSSAACQLLPVPTSHTRSPAARRFVRARQLEPAEAAQLGGLGADGRFELGHGRHASVRAVRRASRQAARRRDGQGRRRQDDRRGRPRPARRPARAAHRRLRGGAAGAARAALSARTTSATSELELAPGPVRASRSSPSGRMHEWLRYQLRSGALAGLLGHSRLFQLPHRGRAGHERAGHDRQGLGPGAAERRTSGARYDTRDHGRPGHRARAGAAARARAPTPNVARVGPDRAPGDADRRVPARSGRRPACSAVALPEEMPVNETVDLERRLGDELGMRRRPGRRQRRAARSASRRRRRAALRRARARTNAGRGAGRAGRAPRAPPASASSWRAAQRRSRARGHAAVPVRAGARAARARAAVATAGGARCDRATGSSASRSASARARAAWARPRPRRRSRSGMAARGQQGRGADDRPGAAARQRARAARAGQRGAARGRRRCDGELWAMMLDAKRTFDELIEWHAPDERTRDAVLSNRIYQELSNARGRLAGVHGDGEALRAAARRAATTCSCSTRRRPATRSTSSTRRDRLSEFIDSRSLQLFTAPGRLGLKVLGPRHRRGRSR